jgi:hypothetical protein
MRWQHLVSKKSNVFSLSYMYFKVELNQCFWFQFKGPVLGFLIGAWMLNIPSSSSHLANPGEFVYSSSE